MAKDKAEFDQFMAERRSRTGGQSSGASPQNWSLSPHSTQTDRAAHLRWAARFASANRRRPWSRICGRSTRPRVF